MWLSLDGSCAILAYSLYLIAELSMDEVKKMPHLVVHITLNTMMKERAQTVMMVRMRNYSTPDSRCTFITIMV